MTTARQRRDHARSVRHCMEQQQLARERPVEVEVAVPPVVPLDQFEQDRMRARAFRADHGRCTLTDEFYLRDIGLNDVLRGSTVRQPWRALPGVLSTKRNP
jgi:hypothetical protein